MGGLIPESFIEELLGRLDIVEVIERHVPLKRAGREYQACCPFHDEKTPSFTVSPQKQFYHCFGCGAHGSVIGFLMNYEGLEFVDAVEDLARHAGLTVPREASRKAQPSAGLYESDGVGRIFLPGPAEKQPGSHRLPEKARLVGRYREGFRCWICTRRLE